jgi:hypothetical protein
MSIKAKLKVVLQAGETVVAEVEDSLLWQRVLDAINKGGGEHFEADPLVQQAGGGNGKPKPPVNDAIDKFAQLIGITREQAIGACSPTTDSPYMHLDSRYWEAMKNQTPERGPSAYSPMAVAATLLALWFQCAELGNATQAQAQAVLATIHIRDRNASRGIQRSTWLQPRSGGVVVLNPAQASRAIAIAKAWCTQDWSNGTD